MAAEIMKMTPIELLLNLLLGYAIIAVALSPLWFMVIVLHFDNKNWREKRKKTNDQK